MPVTKTHSNSSTYKDDIFSEFEGNFRLKPVSSIRVSYAILSYLIFMMYFHPSSFFSTPKNNVKTPVFCN